MVGVVGSSPIAPTNKIKDLGVIPSPFLLAGSIFGPKMGQ
jgi:hypothetical protein